MSVIMKETGLHPMEYIGRGRKSTPAEKREADRVLKKYEKYFGKPISIK